MNHAMMSALLVKKGLSFGYNPNILKKRKRTVQIMTNYDRIKSMSAEEISTAIYNGISNDPCDYCMFNNVFCGGAMCRDISTTEIILKWLNSEVEE